MPYNHIDAHTETLLDAAISAGNVRKKLWRALIESEIAIAQEGDEGVSYAKAILGDVVKEMSQRRAQADEILEEIGNCSGAIVLDMECAEVATPLHSHTG